MSAPDKMSIRAALEKIFSDRIYRSRLAIYRGFTLNMLYAVFRAVTAAIYRSVWFVSIAAYYFSLCLIRGLLVLSMRNAGTDLKKWQSCRMCGIFMLFLGVTMAGMSVQMVRDNIVYHYPQYIIYLSALYTFCITISAVMNVIRFIRLKDPILSASKNITLTGALMSVLVLQTAMIEEFGTEEVVFRAVMNSLTGAAVNLAALLMAVHMIFSSTAQIRRIKNGNNVQKA